MNYSNERSTYDQRTREMADAYAATVEDFFSFDAKTHRTIIELFIGDYMDAQTVQLINRVVNVRRATEAEIPAVEVQKVLTRMTRKKFLRRRRISGTTFYEVNF